MGSEWIPFNPLEELPEIVNAIMEKAKAYNIVFPEPWVNDNGKLRLKELDNDNIK